MLIAAALVIRQCRAECLRAREPRINRPSQPLRAAERIRDALRQDQVLVIARIADQSPAVAVGLSEEIGERTRTAHRLDPLGLAKFSKIADQIERSPDHPIRIGAYGAELVFWKNDGRDRHSIICREADDLAL